MTKRLTDAEAVALSLGNNGQNYITRNGKSLAEIAKARGCRTESKIGVGVRYNFPDGSSIIDTEGGWDLGISLGCWCWDGAGHSEACLEQQADRKES